MSQPRPIPDPPFPVVAASFGPPVGRRRELCVAATRPDAGLDGPLVAVNLLELRRPRAYDLYGLLTYPLLRRCGGRVLWKGARRGQLSGPAADPGRVLLLVTYPDAASFLRLATHPAFAVFSLLRRLALGGFEFGFAARLDAGPDPPPVPRRYRGDRAQLVWLSARESLEAADLPELETAAGAAGARLLFAGRRVATVGTRRNGEAEVHRSRLAPPLPWGNVLVFEGGAGDNGDEAFTILRAAPALRRLGKSGGGTLAAVYRREL